MFVETPKFMEKVEFRVEGMRERMGEGERERERERESLTCE